MYFPTLKMPDAVPENGHRTLKPESFSARLSSATEMSPVLRAVKSVDRDNSFQDLLRNGTHPKHTLLVCGKSWLGGLARSRSRKQHSNIVS